MSLLSTAFVFLLGAATAGAFLARAHVQRAAPPGLLVLVHPILAASGLILLGAGYVRSDGSAVIAAALVLLTVAAGAGMTLGFLRLRRGAAPVPLIVGHATLALVALTLVGYELVAGRSDVPAPFEDGRESGVGAAEPQPGAPTAWAFPAPGRLPVPPAPEPHPAPRVA